ncbi:hypothetical protein HK102_011282 [Quaeritorhiza haematococci]|nr:hypothetical protein HK102_011282 [Quaeritorhiza haematococci]
MGMIVCYGMFYGGFIQLLAGLLEFKNKNVFGATVFSSYGGFWMGLSLWDILAAAKVLPAGSAFPAGRALWLSVWGLLSIALFFPTLRMNRVLQSTFISLIILFYLLAGGVYNETCEKIAGAVGIYCGLSALYVGYANLLKAMYGKWIIPVGDCSGGKH